MDQKTKEYRENLASMFVHVLEEKQLEWKQDWQGKFGNPFNGISGYRYHGINSLNLSLIAAARGYEDPRWATFNQVREKGWKLKNAKGQGVKVEYWFPFDKEKKKAISWGEFRMIEEKSKGRYLILPHYSTVFNASLIEGIPRLPEPEKQQISPDELVSKISGNMEVEIIHEEGNRAYYSLREDKVHLPKPEYFFSNYAYGSTALHELAHATGAPNRLNRDMAGIAGSPAYAYEELVAEISSCFMSANLSMPQDKNHIENHKAYVQFWIKAIKEKPETLVKAVQQAEKVAGYLEYQAELISEKEFEKINASSMEIAEEEGKENWTEKKTVNDKNLLNDEGKRALKVCMERTASRAPKKRTPDLTR